MGHTEVRWDSSGALLGIFFGVSTLLTVLFMNKVQGKAYRIQDYLASRKWHMIQNEDTIAKINKFLVCICWTFFTIPIVTLIFWGAGLIARYDEAKQNVTGGIAVLLVGFSLLFFLYGSFKIKWNRFRMSLWAGISLIIFILFLTAYQISIVFLEDDDSFFGLSAIFLTANAILMIVIVFMNTSRTGTSMAEVIKKLPIGEEKDIKRNTTYSDEITEAYKDDDYIPTQNEIFEMFTINRASKKRRYLGVIEGGLINVFTKMNPRTKFFVSCFLYLLALITIGVYALIDYLVRDDSKLGVITAVAVVATDLIIYLYAQSMICTSPAEISLHLTLFRICLFVLGGSYWIYGYSLLYAYFGIYLVYNIALIRFPFMEEIIEQEVEDMKDDDQKVNMLDIATTPEFLFLLCTVLFGILLSVMEAIKPDGVPLRSRKVDGERFQFWVFGVFALLLVFVVFFFILVYRIFKRKRNGVDSKVYFYVHFKKIDLFWFFLFVLYLLLSIVSVLLYWISDDHRYLIVGLLAPLSVGLLVNAYLKFALNDFNYFQDITGLNKMIFKHNQRIEEVQLKIAEFKKDFASKTGKKFNAEDLNDETIQELARQKLEYKKANERGDENAVSIDRDEEEEEKKAPKPKEEEKFNEDDYEEDDKIEEGGSDDEEERKRMSKPQKFDLKLFEKSFKVERNLFTKAVDIIVNNDKEVEYESKFMGASKGNRKFKLIPNWKDKNGAFAAFITGKCRPNDYHVYLSLMLAYLIVIIMGGIICADRESTEGISWACGFLAFFISFSCLTRPFSCDTGLKPFEIIGYVGSLLLVIIWGLIDFAIRFDFDADEDNEGNKFLIWYILFIPFVILCSTCLYKWYDKKWYFDQFVQITMPLTLIWGIILIICCYIFLGPISGSIFSGIVASIVYGGCIVYIYYKKGGFLPFGWSIFNLSVLSLVAISIFIVALSVDDFVTFVGWSISYGILTLIIFAFGFSSLARDLWHAEDEPIYFSPWIFPVFKYNEKKNDVILRNEPVFYVLVSMILALIWSFQCTVWITPVTVGISVSCLVEVFFIIFVLYLISFTSVMLEDIRKTLDLLIIKRSWLESKSDYVEAKNISSPESMITFEEVGDKRDMIVNHMKRMKKDKNYASQQHEFVWNTKNIDLSSPHACRKYLYEVEMEKTNIFLDEISLIVQFELLLIMHSQNLIQSDRKVLFKFLEIKKHALAAANINIVIPAKGRPKYKHAKVLTQISRLSAEKQVLFKKLREDFQEEEREKEADILEKERIEEEKQKERQERLAKLTEERRKLLEDLDPNMPIDDMPDCDTKYEKILERYKKEKTLYEDKQFPPNDQSLGEGCLNRGVAKWVRASEVEGTVIYRDKIDPRDVVQGALGDCYFLSAMSVLGESNVKETIKFIDNEDESKAGVYWVRFYKYGNVEDVIIDDFFPVFGNGEFAFARGGPDGKELWPMILEKAYAKLNGSYNYIEAGKVQYALSDMTGGVSEQIELRSVASNKNQFWNRLKSFVEQGALMGAGSPEHALGDSAISEFGIVQGHAYAVLGIKEFDEYKLVNLRNPHGNKGIEWNGDWSDDSDMWTQKAKNKCKFSDEADGIFWMDLDDFLDNYSYLYICRIMKNWNHQEFEDEWKGKSAEGLPSANNRNAKLQLNPQYEIKLSSPAPVFIQMTQFDKINMFKGKQFIMFFAQNTGGGKISRMDRKAILGMSGKPTNLNIISNEIALTNRLTFPLTITLLAANTKNGPEGEGKFEIKIYSMSKFTAKKL